MAHGSVFPTAFTNKHFLVSGLSEGTGVFCGRASSEPVEEQLSLEGKLIHISPEGHVVAQPFPSLVRFFLLDATFTLHHIEESPIHAEIVNFLDSNETLVSPEAYPFLHRWFLSTCRHPEALYDLTQPVATPTHPALSFFEQFVATAEEFRRALYRSPQVNSGRELDKVSELEGNLLIEIGKIASQVAIKFNQLITREPELRNHLRAFYGEETASHPRHAIGGFTYLTERLTFTKDFARRSGKPTVVREINAFLKDAFFGLNEVVMDHKNSLDTLITEALSQYGITHEMHGEIQPYVEHRTVHAGKPSSHPSPVGAS